MRVRQNIKEISLEQKTDFVNSILELKKAPSVVHAGNAVSNRYDDYVQLHIDAMMAMSLIDPKGDPNDTNNIYPGWAHNGPAFFTWHRVLLLQLEHDLQKISGNNDLAIPYWDWTDADPKASPFTTDFMGSDGESTRTEDPGKVVDGPFAFDGPNNWTINVNDPMDNHAGPNPPKYLTRGLGRMSAAKTLPDSAMVKKALSNPVYDYPPWKFATSARRGCRAEIEVNLHNLVHRYVNGNMVSMASPNDPVFWLHHANIDRLWGDWQRKNKESCPYSPVGTAPLGHNLYDTLIFHEPSSPPPWTDLYTNVQVLDHLKLGYRYDTDPTDSTFVPSPVIAVQRLSEIPPESREIITLFQRFPLLKDIRRFQSRRRKSKV